MNEADLKQWLVGLQEQFTAQAKLEHPEWSEEQVAQRVDALVDAQREAYTATLLSNAADNLEEVERVLDSNSHQTQQHQDLHAVRSQLGTL